MNQSVGGASRSNALMFSVSGEQKSEKRKQMKTQNEGRKERMMGESRREGEATHKSAESGRKQLQ